MTLWLDNNGKVQSVDGRVMTLTDVDPFDKSMHHKILDWENKAAEEFGKKLGCSSVDIDTVASDVRQKETNAGNFFTDAVRRFHNVAVVLINGGAIRGNKVFGKGDLTKARLTEMHPFGNEIVKIYATGKELRMYINDALDCYEDLCGNFVTVSGLKYTFSPTAEKGSRLKSSMHTDGTEIKDAERLTVGIADYMLSNSPLKHNDLLGMTTKNDAVPLVLALFDEVHIAGDSCIHPAVDGRITMV
eukprot:UN3768